MSETLRDYQVADLAFLYLWHRWNSAGNRAMWVMPKQLMRKNRAELLRFTHFKPDEIPETPTLASAETQVHSARERQLAALRSHVFPPGVSGNAGGRSKSEMQVAVRLRSRLPELTDALFSIALNTRTATVARARAIEVLLERGLGKAQQKVVVETDLAGMTDGQLESYIRAQLMQHVRTIEGQADAAE